MDTKDWIFLGVLVAGYISQLAVLKKGQSNIESVLAEIRADNNRLKDNAIENKVTISALAKLEDERHQHLDISIDEIKGTVNRIWMLGYKQQ